MESCSSVVHIPLKLFPGVAALRRISGYDEQAVADTDSVTAIGLLDRLLVDTPLSDVKPGQAVNLPCAERDYLLAQVYIDNFNDQIISDHSCEHCDARYEISFYLSELLSKVDQDRQHKTKELVELVEQKVVAQIDVPTPYFRLKNGVVLRLPTGVDELQLLRAEQSQAESQLLACCVTTGDDALHDADEKGGTSPSSILQALEVLAPLLDMEIDSRCPECEGEQQVHFTLQTYLLNTMLACKYRLLQEIHTLASTYHWPLGDILTLPRHQRLALLECIENS